MLLKSFIRFNGDVFVTRLRLGRRAVHPSLPARAFPRERGQDLHRGDHIGA